MSSIRPLFTITVLVIVGGYLYLKINEGPAHPQVGAHGAAESDGVPPLAAAAGGAKLDKDTSAPAWPAAANGAPPAPVLPPGVGAPAGAVAGTTASTGGATANAATNMNGVPEVPPIPELPELPKTTDGATTAIQPVTLSATDTAGSKLGASTVAADAPVPLPVMAGSPNSNSAAASPAAITPLPSADAANATTPIGEAAASPAAGSASTPAVPPSVGSLPSIPEVPAGGNSASTPPGQLDAPRADDRYGVSSDPPAQPPVTPLPGAPVTAAAAGTTPSTASASTFAASWPAIQAALDQNDLKQAHQLLSKWHNNETLTPEESQRVEGLLGQLAGTVIYSNEHRLEPARVVKPGETLETIAKEYNVPWQLLAKINSVAAPDQVRPGQELKVVRGPFTAVVDVRRNELTLEVDGRYAGTFPVTIPPGAPVSDGPWLVEQKLAGQQNGVAPASYTSPPAAANHSIVLRSANATGPQQGPTLVIASGGAGAPNAGAATIQVGPQDAEDLSDILSIGSRVVVRR